MIAVLELPVVVRHTT